jgi:hypothetical protein
MDDAGWGYYRIRSQRVGERLDRIKEGWPILIGVRLFVVLALASVVTLLWKRTVIEAQMPVGEPARWIGGPDSARGHLADLDLFACWEEI